MRGLKDKVALVTGAARGIGEATCRRLVDEGCRVVGVDLLIDPLQKIASELGPAMTAVEADISKENESDKYIQAAVRNYGGLHFLVNNAGVVGSFTQSLKCRSRSLIVCIQ